MGFMDFRVESLEAYYNGEKIQALFDKPFVGYSTSDGDLRHSIPVLRRTFQSNVHIEKAWEVIIVVNGTKSNQCHVKREGEGVYSFSIREIRSE